MQLEDGDEPAVRTLMRSLSIDRATALAFVEQGHTTVEEVAYVPFAELRQTRIDEKLLLTVRERARSLLMPRT